MSWHLTSHHKKKYDKAVAAKEKNNPSSTSSQSSIKGYAVNKTSSVVKWKTSSQNYKTATRLIAKWVCTNSRPLSIVEDEGFRELINFLAPEYEVPTHTTISANISSYYEEEKKNYVMSWRILSFVQLPLMVELVVMLSAIWMSMCTI